MFAIDSEDKEKNYFFLTFGLADSYYSTRYHTSTISLISHIREMMVNNSAQEQNMRKLILVNNNNNLP